MNNTPHALPRTYIGGFVLYLWVVVIGLYPLYQYNVDPDGTSYLTIASRYAYGDFATAVNGLWSPWACWLTALLMKVGVPAIPASIAVNTAGATGFLLASQSLFRYYNLPAKSICWFLAGITFFLCFAVYWQTFDDLWGCFLMLVVLRMVLSHAFLLQWWRWVVLGMVGALAYFAKAYSFPYFVLAVGGSLLLTAPRKVRAVLAMAVAIVVLLFVALPWLYALHAKYGIWTTSVAGPLNMSWYLIGHPLWKPDIGILVPPVYPDSVYFWEDPWYANGQLVHWWQSSHLVWRQVLRLGYNTLMMVRCMAEISVLLPVIAVLVLWQFVASYRSQLRAYKILSVFFLALPLGYLLVHIEARYLWVMLPLACIVAVAPATEGLVPARLRAYWVPVMAVSICLFPAWQLVAMSGVGKKEHQLAVLLNEAGISGQSFITNMHPRHMSKVMYFSGNRFYVVNKQVPAAHEDTAANADTLLQEANRYGVPYYLYVPAGAGWLINPGFSDIFGTGMPQRNTTVSYKKKLSDPASGITLYQIAQ